MERTILLLFAVFCLGLYTTCLKNWEFDKKSSQNSDLERATIVLHQGASEDENFEKKPTQSKTNFSDTLCIPHGVLAKRISVIINPISGGKDKEDLAESILQRLEAKGHDVEILFSQAPYHATQLAREAVTGRHADIVAVVGGDGTINEVGQALIGSDAVLAIIPTGSGNGLARHLQIPLKTSEAIDLLETGVVQTIDTVQINDRPYLGVAGIGFDAEVGWSFAQAKQRGFFTYLITVLKMLPRYSACQYDLILDKEHFSKSAFLISFANSSQFGNGASISPQAKMDDGFLDVVIVKKFPFYAAFEMVYRLFHSSLHRSKYVEVIQCREIHIDTPHLKAHIDGEPVLFEEGMHVRLIPSSLKVLVPD